MFLFNKGLSLEKDYQVGAQSNHTLCLTSSCIYSCIPIISIYLTHLELQYKYSCWLPDKRQKLRVPLPFLFSLLLRGLLAIMLNKESTRSRARSRNDNNVGAEIGQNNINANAAQSATAWAAAVLAELPCCLAATSLPERILISCKRICLQLPSSATCPAVLVSCWLWAWQVETAWSAWQMRVGLWPAAAVANLPRSRGATS